MASSPIDAAALTQNSCAKSCTVRLPTMETFFDSERRPRSEFLLGGFNFNVRVNFGTGEVWLARFPTDYILATPARIQPARRTMLSEYETLKILRKMSPEFIPNAWLPDPTPGMTTVMDIC